MSEETTKISRSAVKEALKDIIPLLTQFCFKNKICGSYRRGLSKISSLDIVIIPAMTHQITMSKEAEELFNLIKSRNKKTHTVFQTTEGPIKCTFYIAEECDWGAQIITWTGNASMNILMRGRAKNLGYKLNQYGLWENEFRIAGKTERGIFRKINLTWAEPRQRNR